MKTSVIDEFIKRIICDKSEHLERFYEIFSARGFLLELDKGSGRVRLSNDSHREDSEFLEILQHVNYKKMYHKPHQDAIDKQGNEGITQNGHIYFDNINSQLFDINNDQYLAEVFTQEIPVDLFRLNWERDWYGKFNQFRECEHLPRIRVYDLEPFIARLVKSISSIGISTWSSCEGHWDEPAYIVFDGKYHRIWFQSLYNKFIKKKLNLVCRWDWLGWDERCSIKSPSKNSVELYLEIQNVARLIYDNRIALKNIKKRVCLRLTDKHKGLNQKELLNTFENYFEESISSYLQNERITL
jgi:hypothetical protein